MFVNGGLSVSGGVSTIFGPAEEVVVVVVALLLVVLTDSVVELAVVELGVV